MMRLRIPACPGLAPGNNPPLPPVVFKAMTEPYPLAAPIPGNHAQDALTEFTATGPLEVGLAGDGWLRYAVVDLTDIVEEARRELDLAPIPAVALGRAMSSATLLLRMVAKTPQRLLLEIRGDGPLRNVLVDTDAEGHVRGSVSDRVVHLPSRPDGKLPIGEAIGEGTLQVTRQGQDQGQSGASYTSTVELQTGEIGLDVAPYLTTSEQIPSAVAVGVLARPQGIVGAGGVIVEPLPGTPEEVLARLEGNLADLSGISRLIEDGGHEAALDAVLHGFDDRRVVEEGTVRHRCRCSRELLERHLVMVPDDELARLETDSGRIEGECVFCGSLYRFSPEELAVGEHA